MATTEQQRMIRAAAKDIARRLHRQWNVGWHHLGEDLREALVAERVLHVFTGRPDDGTVPVALISDYLQETRRQAGLATDEETS